MKFATKKAVRVKKTAKKVAGKAATKAPKAAARTHKPSGVELRARKMSFNAGADEERGKVHKHAEGLLKQAVKFNSPVAKKLIQDHIEFLKTRVKRNKARKGGL